MIKCLSRDIYKRTTGRIRISNLTMNKLAGRKCTSRLFFLTNENLESHCEVSYGSRRGPRSAWPTSSFSVAENSVHRCTILGRSTLIAEALPLPEEITLHDRYFAMLASCRKGAVLL